MQGEISKLTLEEFLEYRDYGESIGLPISPNFIFGLPGETLQTAKQSAQFYHELGFAIVPNVNITYPQTRYHGEAVERGIADANEALREALEEWQENPPPMESPPPE